MRFDTVVEGARWDEDAQEWEVQVAGGEPVRATYLVTATGFLSQPRLPDIDGRGRLRRHGGALGEVGPRRRPGRQAGRDHRHRRHRGAADPRAGRAGRPPHRLPAHADLGDPQARPQDAAAGAAGVREGAVHPAVGTQDQHRAARADHGRRRSCTTASAKVFNRDRRADRQAAPAPAGRGPRAAPQADARLLVRLQAPDVLQRLLPHVHPTTTSSSRRPRSSGSRRPASSPPTDTSVADRRAGARDRIRHVGRQLPGDLGLGRDGQRPRPLVAVRPGSRPTRASRSPASRTCSTSPRRTPTQACPSSRPSRRQMKHLERLLTEVRRRDARTFEVTDPANEEFLGWVTERLGDSVFNLGLVRHRTQLLLQPARRGRAAAAELHDATRTARRSVPAGRLRLRVSRRPSQRASGRRRRR